MNLLEVNFLLNVTYKALLGQFDQQSWISYLPLSIADEDIALELK